MPRETLDRLARITADAGIWLVIDETYEDFLFSGQTHYCPNAPNVVHVFSFSKVRVCSVHSSGVVMFSKAVAPPQDLRCLSCFCGATSQTGLTTCRGMG